MRKARKYSKRRNIIFLVLFFLVYTVSLYLVVCKITRDSIITSTLNREQIAVRSASNSIEIFLRLFGESLTLLSSTDLSQNRLEQFVDSWQSTPIAGVIVTDSAGKVIGNVNRLTVPDLGSDLSDRDYFIWARDTRKGHYFVSKPVISRLGASEGKYIVTVAVRIQNNDEFLGVLDAAIIIDELTTKYLKPALFSPESRFYLIDRSGTIIVSPWPQLVGVNYFDYLKTHPYKGSDKTLVALKQAATNPNEGNLQITLPNENKTGLTPFLVSHAPIFYNGNDNWWTLAIATPLTQTPSNVFDILSF